MNQSETEIHDRERVVTTRAPRPGATAAEPACASRRDPPARPRRRLRIVHPKVRAYRA